MPESQQKARNYVIDNAKLLCLFLILYCHIPPVSGFFHSLVNSFSVPVFFFVAGVFFKNNSIREVVRRSARTLLLPYIIFNLLLVICSSSIAIVGHYGFSFERNLVGPLLGIVLGNTGVCAPYKIPGGPSWFLLALFIARLFFAVMLHSSKKMVCLEVTVLVIIYYLLREVVGWGPFSLDGAILGLPFLVIGYFAKNYVHRFIRLDFRIRLTIIIACCLVLVPTVFANGVVDMFSGGYGNNVMLYIVGGVTGCILIIGICSFLDYSNRLTRLFIEGSTFFICMHIMIMEYVQLIYTRALHLARELIVTDKIVISLTVVLACAAALMLIKKFAPRLLKP